MKVEYVSPEKMSDVFMRYLPIKKISFVFSTDVVMNSWIDWCVMNPEKSGVSAVPLSRFIPWDKFKSSFVASAVEGKTSIPSILRKLFVRNLIQQNAKEKFFKSLISEKYAETASSFTDWITKILPSLQIWFEKYQDYQGRNSEEPDAEDMDYLELYKRYSAFLEENNLFEPSWVRADFSGTEENYIIFYPEILEDFAEYDEIFSNCKNITLVSLPKEEEKPVCHKFTDSRKELRRVILKIRNLVEKKEAKYEEITLNIPNLEVYRPYLNRELKKYCIPYVIKAGIPLTLNCAGIIFQEIYNCYNEDFSYESVRALLLDEYIPWKKEIRHLKESLIRWGKDMRCLCSYSNTDNGKKVDVWKEALSAKGNEVTLELNLYESLKEEVNAICKASSFKDILKAWIIFKEKFLEKKFTKEADNIISRCIKTLQEIIEKGENLFEQIGITILNPYDFFLNEINQKTYTPQSENIGVSVYPYRLSAAADFKFQFVLDASQRNLEVPRKRLSFLKVEKRKKFNLLEDDRKYNASSAFIRLYAKGGSYFSFAEKSFDGFAIAHNYFTLSDEREPLQQLDENDFILAEENFFLKETKTPDGFFSESQKEHFENWKKVQKEERNLKEKRIPDILAEKIEYQLKEKRNSTKYSITQSDMKNFFPCPRKWIYGTVLHLKEDSLDTSLMNPYDMGNINHKILNLFFLWCKENNASKLPKVNEKGIFDDELAIRKVISDFSEQTIAEDYRMNFHDSPLTKAALMVQIESITETIMILLHSFCEEEKGFGGFTIVCTEKWLTDENEGYEWSYGGKIDCVLMDDMDSVYIVDFKTGQIPNKGECFAKDEKLGDFQIPLYIKIWNKNTEAKTLENALFYSIKNVEPSYIVKAVKSKGCIETMEQFQSTLDVFEKYAKKFNDMVKERRLLPKKDESDIYNNVESYSTCRKCSYRGICRTCYTIGKEEI